MQKVNIHQNNTDLHIFKSVLNSSINLFKVYIADVKEELNICMERSIHKRSLEEVQEVW